MSTFLARRAGRLPLLALLVAPGGCSEDGGDPPAVAGIHGRLTVHTAQTAHPPEGDPDNFTSVRVILGDGSHFDADTDEVGDVTFEDPDLEGSQDVSVITVSAGTEAVRVMTIAGVNVPELTLGRVFDAGSGEIVATLTGSVTGAADGHQVTVVIYGPDIFGQAVAGADGTYSVDVRGTLGGTADVLAFATDPESTAVVAAGLALDVAFDRATVSQDISLDHPMDATLLVTLEGLERYGGGEPTGSLSFQREGRPLFTAVGTSEGATVSLPTFALSPPFDDVVRLATVQVGDVDARPTGSAIATAVPHTSADGVTITLPTPANVVEPPLGPEGSPSASPLGALRVAWTADLDAVYVAGMLRQDEPGTFPAFEWSFYAPAEWGEFVPFVLPDDTAPIRSFPAGRYFAQLRSWWHEGATRPTDAFDDSVVNIIPAPGPLTWSTDVRGYVQLE